MRGNVSGELQTFVYGRAVQTAAERIETEAVFHYRPGARILSLGNVGCNLNCSFCQNWETSQARHLATSALRQLTPEGVVSLAERFGIGVLSWTYNDPVVWHEFVLDTARLARKHGILNLYKSACFIEEKPVRELCEAIDIFSISLKSVLPRFYERHCLGTLAPVLRTIRAAHAAGAHVEISQLVVTDLNDDLEASLAETVRWVLDNVGADVPLHFVRFHPAYRYTSVPRTPIETLVAAREQALTAGVHHCYVGNVYLRDVSDTFCHGCGQRLVRRFGLSTQITGIDAMGNCVRCGAPSPIREPFGGRTSDRDTAAREVVGECQTVSWNEEVNNVHVVTSGKSGEALAVLVEHLPTGEQETLDLGLGLERAVVSRQRPEETGIVVRWPRGSGVALLPLLDRAHYPAS